MWERVKERAREKTHIWIFSFLNIYISPVGDIKVIYCFMTKIILSSFFPKSMIHHWLPIIEESQTNRLIYSNLYNLLNISMKLYQVYLSISVLFSSAFLEPHLILSNIPVLFFYNDKSSYFFLRLQFSIKFTCVLEFCYLNVFVSMKMPAYTHIYLPKI